MRSDKVLGVIGLRCSATSARLRQAPYLIAPSTLSGPTKHRIWSPPAPYLIPPSTVS